MRVSRALAAATLALLSLPGLASEPANVSVKEGVVDIGERLEMFVDSWFIQEMRGAALKLHEPVRREVVWQAEKPWEGTWCAYFTVLRDGDVIRIYYRASNPGRDASEDQYTCVIESRDGVRFTRPELGLVEFEGSRANNIIWKGPLSHNFAPFVDANPDARPGERYKAVASVAGNPERPGRLYALSSPDGIRWKPMREEPLDLPGAFDSLNVAFWDPHTKVYRCYSRIFLDGCRSIQSSISKDFLNWSPPVPNSYPEGAPPTQMYTNATIPCPGAEHILLSFPKRFVEERKKLPDAGLPGVSDAIFMSSRDGAHWDRSFLEAWVRPGPDPLNWSHRNNMPAWGIVQTGPDEFSMYISEHAGFPTTRLRRLSVRRHGFASVHAGFSGGEMLTRAFTFSGEDLILNYSTSAAGSLKVEVLDAAGEPVPGFTLAEAPELFGDELDAVYRWKNGRRLAELRGRPIRLRFVLKDADLFAIRTGQAAPRPPAN